TLPAVVRWIGVARHGTEEHRRELEAERAARNDAMDAGLKRLEEIVSAGGAPDDVAEILRLRDQVRRQFARRGGPDDDTHVERGIELRLELIAAEREFLYELLRGGKVTDESRRRIERELDLEEEIITCRREGDKPL